MIIEDYNPLNKVRYHKYVNILSECIESLTHNKIFTVSKYFPTEYFMASDFAMEASPLLSDQSEHRQRWDKSKTCIT